MFDSFLNSNSYALRPSRLISPIISFSISTAVVVNIKKLSWDGDVRYWRKDLFTRGIFFVKLFPILAKKLLKASSIDLGSLNSASSTSNLGGAEPDLDLRLTSCPIPFQTFLELDMFTEIIIIITVFTYF